MKTFITTFLSVLAFGFAGLSQNGLGAIKGKIKDRSTAEPLPFVNVVVSQGGNQVVGGTTDFDGVYYLKGVAPGTYDIVYSMVGYNSQKRTGVIVKSDKITFLDIDLTSGVDLAAVEVVKYTVPLIDRDGGASGASLGREERWSKGSASGSVVSRSEIAKMPGRSVNSIVATVGGVTHKRGEVSVRGSRQEGGSFYYIDGIKVRGSENLPKSAVNQISIISGGTPASYENRPEGDVVLKIQKPIPPKPVPDNTYQIEQIREQYNEVVDNVFESVEKAPLSTFSIDVDNASYSNVRRYIQRGSVPPIDAVRIEELINYFTYSYPQPEGDDPFSITTTYTECPWNLEHRLIHIGMQGKQVEIDTVAPNNLVFLIDVSGSMSSSDKLGLLKSGLKLLVEKLRPEDKVAIVVYAGAAGLVLPSTSGAEKSKIRNVIGELTAGGSTAGGEGIQLAYKIAKQNFIKGGNNRVILATDGDFNVGVSSQDGLIKLIESKREDDIFLSVLGFGTGNYQDGKMEQLADKGNGNYNYIDNLKEAKKVLVNEFQSTLITIAKDVKTQIEFNPYHVKAYRMVGYVNRRLNPEDFNDDTKDAGEMGAGHSVTLIYEVILANSDEPIPGSIDELKYQPKKTRKLPTGVGFQNEVATVKFRYKEPEGKKSKLLFKTIQDESTALKNASENVRFSAAVALFGMSLRNSAYRGHGGYELALEIAKEARGEDKYGYRAEFIELLEMAMLLER